MTVKKHNGNFGTGTIVGYTSYNGSVFYAHKLVQEIYVSEIGEYRWVAQYGKVTLADDKFVADNGGKTFYLYSDKEIRDGYPETWTKGVEFKKGDILEAEDRNGQRVVFLYETKDLVHRLTPYNGSSTEVSWAGLDTYRQQVKNIRVVKTRTSGKLFSEI